MSFAKLGINYLITPHSPTKNFDGEFGDNLAHSKEQYGPHNKLKGPFIGINLPSFSIKIVFVFSFNFVMNFLYEILYLDFFFCFFNVKHHLKRKIKYFLFYQYFYYV